MTKTELIRNTAAITFETQETVAKVLDGLIAKITTSLKLGEDIKITGFGTFSVSHREARTGHNPQNGEPVDIPATNVAKFKPGKTLKDAIN